MKTSPTSEETSRHRLFELEPDINDLFGATMALTVFSEKTFHRDDAIKDERGHLQFFMEADEKEALFYLIYAINSSARSLYRGFHGNEVQS